MTDFATNSYQDFSFGVQQGYREGVTNVWSGSMSNMTSDQSHDVQGGVEKNLLTVPSVTQTATVRDDKYWERRRRRELFSTQNYKNLSGKIIWQLKSPATLAECVKIN